MRRDLIDAILAQPGCNNPREMWSELSEAGRRVTPARFDHVKQQRRDKLKRFNRKTVWVLVAGVLAAGSAQAVDLAGAPSTVIASRGGATVTISDIDAFAQKIPEDKRPGYFNSPKRIESTIDNILLAKQLSSEARSAGLDKQPLVQLQIEAATNEALSAARMQQYERDLKVPDMTALAQEEFIAHKEKYVQKGEFVVEHILITTASRSDDEARKLAETIAQKAKADPAQFESLVEQYSDDQSKVTNHGKVEDAGNSKLYDAAFVDAVKKLDKPNEISPVVKSAFGYHVIKLIVRTPDVVPSFAEVKDRILAELKRNYIEKSVRGHTDDLRNMPMDTNADLLNSLRSRFLIKQ